jgi:hypothetical protein
METMMKRFKLLGAVALLTAILPLSTSSSSLAAGQGPGPCTRPSGAAVAPEGPAMSGGQLMAGVGQCRYIESPNQARYYQDRYHRDRGYDAPDWNVTGSSRDY